MAISVSVTIRHGDTRANGGWFRLSTVCQQAKARFQPCAGSKHALAMMLQKWIFREGQLRGRMRFFPVMSLLQSEDACLERRLL